jgi:hypothetical protein
MDFLFGKKNNPVQKSIGASVPWQEFPEFIMHRNLQNNELQKLVREVFATFPTKDQMIEIWSNNPQNFGYYNYFVQDQRFQLAEELGNLNISTAKTTNVSIDLQNALAESLAEFAFDGSHIDDEEIDFYAARLYLDKERREQAWKNKKNTVLIAKQCDAEKIHVIIFIFMHTEIDFLTFSATVHHNNGNPTSFEIHEVLPEDGGRIKYWRNQVSQARKIALEYDVAQKKKDEEEVAQVRKQLDELAQERERLEKLAQEELERKIKPQVYPDPPMISQNKSKNIGNPFAHDNFPPIPRTPPNTVQDPGDDLLIDPTTVPVYHVKPGRVPLPVDTSQPPAPGQHPNLPTHLWEWSCGKPELEELWRVMVLPVLKKPEQDKELLMRHLLPVVGRELFGIQCNDVHEIETKNYKDDGSSTRSHHHVMGNTDLGKLFIVYRRNNRVRFLYQGRIHPQNAIHKTITLDEYLEEFFSSDGTWSASDTTEENDLLVGGDPFQRAIEVPVAQAFDDGDQRTVSYYPPLQDNPLESQPLAPFNNRAQSPISQDPRNAYEREYDRRRWDRPDPNGHERMYFRHITRNP